jgi:cobyrinic acid a,c-diamide synthase
VPRLGARIVVAGTSSGVGKTTVATGLMAAFAARGLQVASAKVGPDFIDPGYHSLATGRPARNLDAWISGEELIAPLAGRAGSDADLLVVEGVMGLFDGAADDGRTASTAHVARLLQAPVVLVVDVAAMSSSVAALVHGFASFDRTLDLAGVVLNRVGSDGHELMLREALAPLGVQVLGVLGRDRALTWRDRHLGLVPVAEDPTGTRTALDRLAATVALGCDLQAIEHVARRAPALTVTDPPVARPSGSARVAVAAGPAFTFSYPDNLELLSSAGAELVPFDPLVDDVLPEGCGAVYVGGGFPEVYGAELAANRPLLADVAAKAATGTVVWAECGGLLWLAESLDGHRLVGAVPAQGHMGERLVLGYRTARVQRPTPIARPGTVLRGHEFHYSELSPPGDALLLEGRFGGGAGGYASRTLLATYLHLHLAATPELAERFVGAASAARAPSAASLLASGALHVREPGVSPGLFPQL